MGLFNYRNAVKKAQFLFPFSSKDHANKRPHSCGQCTKAESGSGSWARVPCSEGGAALVSLLNPRHAFTLPLQTQPCLQISPGSELPSETQAPGLHSSATLALPAQRQAPPQGPEPCPLDPSRSGRPSGCGQCDCPPGDSDVCSSWKSNASSAILLISIISLLGSDWRPRGVSGKAERFLPLSPLCYQEATFICA